MGRKPNPDRIARETLITRGITEIEYRVIYVVKGEEQVKSEFFKEYGTAQLAERKIKAHVKELNGVLVSIEKLSETCKLYGMKIPDYIAAATVLDENYTPNKESEEE